MTTSSGLQVIDDHSGNGGDYVHPGIRLFKTTGTSFTVGADGGGMRWMHIHSSANLASKVSIECVYGQTASITKSVKKGDLYITCASGNSQQPTNSYVCGYNFFPEYLSIFTSTSTVINSDTGSMFSGYILRF